PPRPRHRPRLDGPRHGRCDGGAGRGLRPRLLRRGDRAGPSCRFRGRRGRHHRLRDPDPPGPPLPPRLPDGLDLRNKRPAVAAGVRNESGIARNMKVVVCGSGVIGVTSAYYLTTLGHEVVVVDRQPGPGLETSFANAGQVSW